MKHSAIIALILVLLAPAASAQWTLVPQPPDSFQGIEVFYAGDDRIYAGTFNGRVFSSTDHADTWTLVADGLPEATYAMVASMVIVGDRFIISRFAFEGPGLHNFRSRRVGNEWTTWVPLAYQADIFSHMAAIGGTLFVVREGVAIDRSDDHGTSWTTLTVPGASSGWKIFAREGRLFAAEQVTNGGTIYRSDDLGATWVEIGAGLGSSRVTSEIHWQGHLLVGVDHGGYTGSLWSSPDLGDSWQLITTLPTGNTIWGMASARDGRLAIGVIGTVSIPASIWLSSDLAAWEDYTGDLVNRPFTSLVAHDGWFFKTGTSGAEFRAPQPGLSAVGRDAPAAAVLELSAHPNPFNPQTTIAFELPQQQPVSLRVFDVAGRLVKQLIGGEVYDQGRHEAVWRGRNEAGRQCGSGTYIYRLEAGGFSEAKRVVLVK